jgi:hypothetical protein
VQRKRNLSNFETEVKSRQLGEMKDTEGKMMETFIIFYRKIYFPL